MRAATAKIVVEGAGDFRACWRRIAIEQRLGRDQNAAETISALARLLLEKGLLQRMWLLRRTKNLNRCCAPAGHASDRRAAGLYRGAVDQDDAAAALFTAATEPGAGACQVVA